MTVFVCLDDNNGMLFNSRRQSRDKAVIEDMLRYAGDEKIRMNPYSAKLFEGAADRIVIEEDFSGGLPEGSFCFLENMPVKPWEDSVETVVAYCWNRVYPADTWLDIDLEHSWEVVDSIEFGGNSHEEITRKTYRRKED